jgi:hypothetical protein
MGLYVRFITSTNPTNYTCIKLMELILFFTIMLYFYLLFREIFALVKERTAY